MSLSIRNERNKALFRKKILLENIGLFQEKIYTPYVDNVGIPSGYTSSKIGKRKGGHASKIVEILMVPKITSH